MCGVFGVLSAEREVARLTYFGLFALQHRGQESAGIAVSDAGRLTVLREMGLVAHVFDEEKLQALPGDAAIGHTRYSTTGSTHWSNAQPVVHHGGARTVALGHNGNLTNSGELRATLEAEGIALGATSDTELIAALLARDAAPLPQAVAHTMARLEGAYSVVVLAEGKLVGFRDPHGIRPLVVGRLPRSEGGADWVLASETCALDLVGAAYVRDVRPGEVVVVDAQGLHALQALPEARGALCIFEHVYFARPDSKLAGSEVHGVRVRMGERLAAEAPVEADLVLPIPDSGTPAAVGYARASGIPYSEGLIKNRYVGRTFIQPDDHLRRQGIRLKFNPLAEVEGQRLVIVDDSIVRGHTMRQLVAMLHDAGAAEVHVRISSPPVVSPCFYGIDMGDDAQLAAARHTVEELREEIGAASLHYLSLDGMQAATRLPEGAVCRACFTREYPTRVPAARNLAKLRFEPVA
ncbi:MAG TPA: amidophosphoribosyltransferase [Gaiellaceae bacterium]|jgi:amidophosphoribosyltransferase|nr:amidophosphoribosyltransferase [Gaiellaceae bacterium]